jgi:hypothetical protein
MILFMNWYKKSIKLTEIYDEHELHDNTEYMTDFIDKDDLDIDFPVKTMLPVDAKNVKMPHGDLTVFQAFNEHASQDQRNLVNEKMRPFDPNRVVLLINETLLDGHHHLVAGILSNNPIKYINLSDQ